MYKRVELNEFRHLFDKENQMQFISFCDSISSDYRLQKKTHEINSYHSFLGKLSVDKYIVLCIFESCGTEKRRKRKSRTQTEEETERG